MSNHNLTAKSAEIVILQKNMRDLQSQLAAAHKRILEFIDEEIKEYDGKEIKDLSEIERIVYERTIKERYIKMYFIFEFETRNKNDK